MVNTQNSGSKYKLEFVRTCWIVTESLSLVEALHIELQSSLCMWRVRGKHLEVVILNYDWPNRSGSLDISFKVSER